MNILYIDHYAGSISMGMEFRPFYLAREWERMGHKVRILTAEFAHIRKNNPDVNKDFELQTIDGIEYQFVKTRKYEGNGIARAITMGQFVAKIWLNAGKIVGDFKPDVVISSSTYPMDAYAAFRIKKKAKCQMIHEIHDMWPITPIELYGMSPRHPFVMLVQAGENFFCKHADKVVSILPCAAEYLMEHGMKPEKFHYIANGIDLEDWNHPEQLPEEHQGVFNNAREQGRYVISFFGSHTRSYSLDYLIEALAKIDRSRLFVAFVGSGNYKNELITMVEEKGFTSDEVAFLPPINKRAIPSLLECSDASYVGAIKNRMFRFGIGMNKLFDAMMGQKPILYAVDAPNNLIKEFQCGISVAAEDAEALSGAIVELQNKSQEEQRIMGQNGRKAILENFTYPVLAEKFVKVMEERA